MNQNPQPLPPPPGRVRGQLGGTVWFGRIFMLPHALIGIGATGYLLRLFLWRLFVTVLFLRNNPNFSTLCEFDGYYIVNG